MPEEDHGGGGDSQQASSGFRGQQQAFSPDGDRKSADIAMDRPLDEEEALREWGGSSKVKDAALREMCEWLVVTGALGMDRVDWTVGSDGGPDPEGFKLVSADGGRTIGCPHGRRFVLRFLHCTKFKVPQAKEMMARYVRMRRNTPAWFRGLGSDDPQERFLDLLDGYVFVAPGKDRCGRRVLVNMAAMLNPEVHTASDMMRASMLTLESLLFLDEETQVRGLTYVLYCHGLTWNHARIFSPSEGTQVIFNCQSSLPIKHKAAFCVALPFAGSQVLKFARCFLNEKLRNRIHLIPGPDDLLRASDSLLDCPDTLPVELVGPAKARLTVSDMASMWKAKVKSVRGHLRRLDQITVPPSS